MAAVINAPGRGRSRLSAATPTNFEMVADGIWTWFTRPEAVYRNGATYVGWVNSSGDCGISKYVHSTETTTSFTLASALETDDHNNTSILFLSDGKIMACYGQHNDGTLRYRISTNAEDISAWGSALTANSGQGPYSYPHPMIFSDDSTRVWWFSRRWVLGSSSTRALSMRSGTGIGGGSPSWTNASDVYKLDNKIPYWKLASDGVSKLHVAATDQHPNQGQSSLYHFVGTVNSSGVWSWAKSDGTSIGTSPPFGPSDCTQIYDGSSVRCWVSDICIDSDARPRVLWMKYPNNNGNTIEYWHSRWTGSAWTSHKITDDGSGLYSGEEYYHGGLCFDATDPTRVYLSAPNSGVRQIQEWRTTDSGATWARQRYRTDGGTAGNPLRARPISPRGHNGEVRVLWWQGTYTSYTSYSTAIYAAREP